MSKLPPLNARPERLDESFKRVWVIGGVLIAALTTGAGYAAKTYGLLEKKADASTVRADEGELGKVKEEIAAVKTDVAAVKSAQDDFRDGQRWQMGFDLQVAQRLGVQPQPTPTPRAAAHPTETP